MDKDIFMRTDIFEDLTDIVKILIAGFSVSFPFSFSQDNKKWTQGVRVLYQVLHTILSEVN